MGELSDMIGRLGTEAQQATSLERQRAAERAEDQRRSNQRGELIVQMALHHHPKLLMYKLTNR